MRLLSLDVLRAVAIFLVIGFHADWKGVSFYCAPWKLGGWVGVDLFFVLSGFLISGLLFNEIKKTRTINLPRFLIRRVWKIYPPLFVLLVFSWFFQLYVLDWNVPITALISELILLTNYATPMWGYTWSIAVEEHFYLTLPLLLWMMRFHLHRLPVVVAVVAAAALVFRFVTPWPTAYFSTHTRFDALMFGVLLGYGFSFHREMFVRIGMRFRPYLWAGGIALLVPVFVLDHHEHRWMQTFGFTIQSLGCGVILVAAVASEWQPRRTVKLLAKIGSYSYSIYLWHMICWHCCNLLSPYISPDIRFVLFFASSVGVGMLMSVLVEQPCLRLRDTLFRREGKSAAVVRIPSVLQPPASAC
jgi:peptidoglycan/LPS O-acetylase OafA/YrhL